MNREIVGGGKASGRLLYPRRRVADEARHVVADDRRCPHMLPEPVLLGEVAMKGLRVIRIETAPDSAVHLVTDSGEVISDSADIRAWAEAHPAP